MFLAEHNLYKFSVHDILYHQVVDFTHILMMSYYTVSNRTINLYQEQKQYDNDEKVYQQTFTMIKGE